MGIETAHRILLCLRYGIGDLLMELPAIGAVRAAAPDAHITALGAHPAIELLQGDGRIDALVSVQNFGYRRWDDAGDDASNAAFTRWIDAQGFDAVLDASHAVFGARNVVWSRTFPALYDVSRELQSEGLALGFNGAGALRYAVGRSWGLELPEQAIAELRLTPDERRAAADVLTQRGIGESRLAGLSTAASSPLKRWPGENFAQTAEYLKAQGFTVLALATPEEGSDDDRPAAAGHVRVPVSHLRVTAALLARCAVFVCNDTGLMHLATAVNCPAVAIFGPTSPRIYAAAKTIPVSARDGCPCRKEHEFGPPECVVAGRCERGEPPCIARVTTAEVITALDKLLHGDKPCAHPTGH